MLIGTNGVQTQYSQKVIEQHLPEDWTYYPNSSGKQHHIYEDDEGVESTVHPARYYDPDSEVPCRLPNGWDRRLDSWGNLFFVDHHTKQAVREDPRFNRKVDQETALPKGWQKVKDHRGHPFFYTLRGKVVVGTDIPSSMNSKSMEGKMRLSRAPVNGDDPTLLREKTRRQIEDENMQKAAASVVPMMTPLEKETYWKLFGQVQKASRFFATIEEILVFCEVFDLSRDIIVCAFTNTDTNRDDQWNIDEFANALYEIKFELEKKYRTNTTPPMTTDERRKYHSMYEQYKHPEQPVLRTREVSAACKEYGLPDDKLKSIWRQADLNHDWRWNIDEFADAMHETINEARRRKGMLIGLPYFSISPFCNVHRLMNGQYSRSWLRLHYPLLQHSLFKRLPSCRLHQWKSRQTSRLQFDPSKRLINLLLHPLQLLYLLFLSLHLQPQMTFLPELYPL